MGQLVAAPSGASAFERYADSSLIMSKCEGPRFDGTVDVREVIATINRTCAAYAATLLEHLPSGLRLNPLHRLLARAFRMGVSDRLFFAVGSKRLRVEAVNQDQRRLRTP